MLPPTLSPSLASLLSQTPTQATPSTQATCEDNQQQLLNNQNRILQLTSRYIDELESKPVSLENVQVLGGLAMASDLSSNYIDYQA